MSVLISSQYFLNKRIVKPLGPGAFPLLREAIVILIFNSSNFAQRVVVNGMNRAPIQVTYPKAIIFSCFVKVLIMNHEIIIVMESLIVCFMPLESSISVTRFLLWLMEQIL